MDKPNISGYSDAAEIKRKESLLEAAQLALKALSREWFILNPEIDSEDESEASDVRAKLKNAINDAEFACQAIFKSHDPQS